MKITLLQEKMNIEALKKKNCRKILTEMRAILQVGGFWGRWTRLSWRKCSRRYLVRLMEIRYEVIWNLLSWNFRRHRGGILWSNGLGITWWSDGRFIVSKHLIFILTINLLITKNRCLKICTLLILIYFFIFLSPRFISLVYGLIFLCRIFLLFLQFSSAQ